MKANADLLKATGYSFSLQYFPSETISYQAQKSWGNK